MFLASFFSNIFPQPSSTAVAPPQQSFKKGTKGGFKRPNQKARRIARKTQAINVRRREVRSKNTTEWTTDPDRLIGEVVFWNDRQGVGYVQVDHEDFDSEVIIYSRDIILSEEQEEERQRKRIWKSCLVSFEMLFDNQPRGVNIYLLTGKEAMRYKQGKEVLFDSDGYSYSSSEDEDESEQEDEAQQALFLKVTSAEAAAARRALKAKAVCTTSRRARHKDARLDLEEWKKEKFDDRTFDPEFDDVEVVQKRRKDRQKRPKQKPIKTPPAVSHRVFKPRRAAHRPPYVPPKTKTRPSRSARHVSASQSNPSRKWIKPKKDDHFDRFYKMFERVLTTKQTLQSRDVINLVIQKLYQHISVSDGLHKHIQNARCSSPLPPSDSCPVCLMEFEEEKQNDKINGEIEEEEKEEKEENVKVVRLFNCRHSVLCTVCFQRNISIAIRDEEVLPWLICPAEKCRAPIHHADFSLIPVTELYQFASIVLQKQLTRSPHFVDCEGNDKEIKCNFGFLLTNVEKPSKKNCKVCGLSQIIKPKKPEDLLDDTFKKMFHAGTLRLCPVCSHPAMKDYGMCNVMQCGKCGIYWNWSSKETGATYVQVKQSARSRGSLWEPGELSYQQNLQSSNPRAFKEFLERNGIKYDPNFVRGRS